MTTVSEFLDRFRHWTMARNKIQRLLKEVFVDLEGTIFSEMIHATI